MKTFAIASAVCALLASVAAVPAAPALFTLKSVSTSPDYNGLCLESYHTGAGFGDAVFSECTSTVKPSFYQNGTAVYFTGFGSGVVSGLQVISGIIMYDDWAPVTINIGDPTNNLRYSAKTGFLQTKEYGGLGFIACKWAHAGSIQLFSVAEELPKGFPCNCAEIKLVKG